MSLYGIGDGTAALQAAGAVPTVVRKTTTYVAGTTGATGQHTLFTVTGLVKFKVYAICTSNLTSGGAATISIGNAGAVDDLVAATAYTSIVSGAFLDGSAWAAGTAFASDANSAVPYLSNGEDITENIASATVTGGVVTHICEYIPLSAGASVVAA